MTAPSAAPARAGVAPLTSHLRVTGAALLLVLLYGGSVALFVLTVVGLPLIPIAGVGVPMVLAAVWLTRRYTDLHRWLFAVTVNVPIARPYQAWPGGHLGHQLLRLLREPATWRDLLWLPVAMTVGLLASVLVLAMAAVALWYVALPLVWLIVERAAGVDTAATVLRSELGVWTIDSQARAVAATPLALVGMGLWWWLAPTVFRGYARLSRVLLGPSGADALAARVRQLTESRAETVDAQAAELRRIERDLHDGAQARLVSLGMSLGMAEELVRTDPQAAARLLAEARDTSGEALAELRALVRGMHPPVLADRGLSGAVQALALAHPVPVAVEDQLPGRPAAPVESAVYFAVSEALTNVSKHAEADSASVSLGYDQGRLRAVVTDDDQGGAAVSAGGGLGGVQRRLSAFDGTVSVHSPEGGPTIVTMEVPCELSSAKTTPSSATG